LRALTEIGQSETKRLHIKATSRISIRTIDNIHEEILEEVEANTFSPANASLDDPNQEKSSIIRPTPLNYAQEYLYIKMTTTRSPGSGGRHQTMLSPLREAKSARSRCYKTCFPSVAWLAAGGQSCD
jgi:hypothetical protein